MAVYIDGEQLLSELEEWLRQIDDLHRDPVVEGETLELVMDIVKRHIFNARRREKREVAK